MTLKDARGATLEHSFGAVIVATFHPSAALRAPEEAQREATYRALVDDLARAKRLLEG
jgi:DNA polymerase